jgi:hypothetical protein
MEKYERKFVASCETFSGYNILIDITQIETIDDIISYFKKKLESVLKAHNFEALIEILKKTIFHIHSHTIEEILTSNVNDIFFICNHC